MNAAVQQASAASSREDELRRLNEEYVRASLMGDVRWFETHLARDFVCIESDGSVHFREGFLRLAAIESDLAEYRLDYVDVRLFGDVALVRASGSWARKDGVRGISRYTDVYVYNRGA